jgi:hypothetical protein
MKTFSRWSCVLLSFVLTAVQGWPQATPSPGPAAPGQAAPNPASNAAPAGITNGTLPIESTILAYKILVADAARIDQSLSTKTAGTIVVVGTSADIAAIVQLRIVVSQANILEQRLISLTAAMNAIVKPNYANPVIKGNPALGAGFIASPADVATLIQTLGSITAVNQTMSSAAGALNDGTLITLIAQGINADAVYIPSAYPPNLITDTDISDTNIGAALIRLEAARRNAIAVSNDYLQGLKDAAIVATTVRGGRLYTNAEIDGAGVFAERAVTVNALANAITLASSAADGFETSLFTGQGYSPAPTPQTNTPTPTSPGPAPMAPALPAPVPAPPLPAAPAPAGPAPLTAQNQGQQPVTPSGTTLQQLISADLLLRQILSNPNYKFKLELLSVHALESGGGQLTKSNLFLGSRIYFGGGAVASFALYDSDGTAICSGVGYGYRGNIREKNVQTVLADPTPAVATVSTTCD